MPPESQFGSFSISSILQGSGKSDYSRSTDSRSNGSSHDSRDESTPRFTRFQPYADGTNNLRPAMPGNTSRHILDREVSETGFSCNPVVRSDAGYSSGSTDSRVDSDTLTYHNSNESSSGSTDAKYYAESENPSHSYFESPGSCSDTAASSFGYMNNAAQDTNSGTNHHLERSASARYSKTWSRPVQVRHQHGRAGHSSRGYHSHHPSALLEAYQSTSEDCQPSVNGFVDCENTSGQQSRRSSGPDSSFGKSCDSQVDDHHNNSHHSVVRHRYVPTGIPRTHTHQSCPRQDETITGSQQPCMVRQNSKKRTNKVHNNTNIEHTTNMTGSNWSGQHFDPPKFSQQQGWGFCGSNMGGQSLQHTHGHSHSQIPHHAHAAVVTTESACCRPQMAYNRNSINNYNSCSMNHSARSCCSEASTTRPAMSGHASAMRAPVNMNGNSQPGMVEGPSMNGYTANNRDSQGGGPKQHDAQMWKVVDPDMASGQESDYTKKSLNCSNKRPPIVRLDRPCLHCGITESCTWRPGPEGRSTLCNTCGYFYRRRKCLSMKRKGLHMSIKSVTGEKKLNIQSLSRMNAVRTMTQ
ncbi:hypothetical protein SARC_06126 [Sphaeroforma arctica JP610]|uniref:GATA-type domain-containing protein n=1 Tax=Sphaeroforma arctica JP610 TaxID=667725 RepID=A0A0L0FYB6_9EUKA|nr:hypothetical protein SARC_06126 [Sphaeroforma arctica JP610]KNC81551.1 hypothetical protein SARC_06126 [Sphaeroforma arctica JP610]|eukprot:XP_014155453.1 hypothetical protein SARC_06126 [Sphaeroforma arctica JP610]